MIGKKRDAMTGTSQVWTTTLIFLALPHFIGILGLSPKPALLLVGAVMVGELYAQVARRGEANTSHRWQDWSLYLIFYAAAANYLLTTDPFYGLLLLAAAAGGVTGKS